MGISREEINKVAKASADEITRRLNPEEEALKLELYHGQMVKIGDADVLTVVLPDWDLNYIAFPEGGMPKYRSALMRTPAKIVKVTKQRIYFEQ